MECVDHLLGSTDGKCRNENAAPAGGGLANYLRQLCSGAFYGFVVSVSVGRLHYQRVSALGRNWIPDNGQPTSADVSGKGQPFRLPLLCTIDQH